MKIIPWIKSHYLISGLAAGALALVLFFWGGAAMESIGSRLANRQIQQLEQARKTAEDNGLKLQGQVEAKNAEIGRLNERLTESNQQVIEASQHTAAAQTNYNKVRAGKPVFRATDDSGRVNELRSDLDGLYPNP